MRSFWIIVGWWLIIWKNPRLRSQPTPTQSLTCFYRVSTQLAMTIGGCLPPTKYATIACFWKYLESFLTWELLRRFIATPICAWRMHFTSSSCPTGATSGNYYSRLLPNNIRSDVDDWGLKCGTADCSLVCPTMNQFLFKEWMILVADGYLCIYIYIYTG